MKVIITGTTGMVGEGVLFECLGSPELTEVLSVSRKPSGAEHPKLKEYIVSYKKSSSFRIKDIPLSKINKWNDEYKV